MAKITASVLAFEKKLVCSDGFFHGTNWDARFEASTPLTLIEKSVRGTISNRLKPAIEKDPVKLNAEVEKPNLQTVDSCALNENQDTLKVSFTLKILGGIENPSACNCENFKRSYVQAVKNYITQEGFFELAKRYVTNIANARFLWRNRVGAEKMEVIVKMPKQAKQWNFTATQHDLRQFNSDDIKIKELTDLVASALSGKSENLFLEIETYAQVGKAQEVYPSEELVLDKGKGDKSKILYSVNHTAAMHSQKIGNALRTIDTWYPEFDTAGIGPIAVEVYGAVTNLGKAFRTPKDKVDFYNLFDRFATGESLANKDQEHYVMAVLVRGGVFGQSSKDKE